MELAIIIYVNGKLITTATKNNVNYRIGIIEDTIKAISKREIKRVRQVKYRGELKIIEINFI